MALKLYASKARAVDHEGEVLESYVTKCRIKQAALMFLKKVLRKHGPPNKITADKRRAYSTALKQIGVESLQDSTQYLIDARINLLNQAVVCMHLLAVLI